MVNRVKYLAGLLLLLLLQYSLQAQEYTPAEHFEYEVIGGKVVITDYNQHKRMNWLDFFRGGETGLPQKSSGYKISYRFGAVFSSQPYFPWPWRFYDSFERLY